MGHGVQFFVDPGYLVRRVAAFLAPSLADGTALVVARPATIAAIAEQLAGHGVIAALEARRLVTCDADELLPKLFVDGAIDRAAFASEVASRVGELATRGELRVYGELVDVLWERGEHAAVLALEEQWHQLLGEQRFSLLCGYQLRGPAPELGEICKVHGEPSAAYLAELEQRALALETEVAHRRQLEERLAQLLAVTGDLASATDRDTIAKIAVDRGLTAVGAAFGGLWLVDGGGRSAHLVRVSELLRVKAERWRTLSLDSDAPVACAIRDREPIFIESLAAYRARFPASFGRVAETIESADLVFAMLPIATDGAPFGALAVTFRTTQALAASDRAYLEILARQCAHAFERVRLLEDAARAFREERDAHLDATEATRARDEILGVVSHDLRNPLGTILMGAASLLQFSDPTDKRSQRIRTVAERIHRQAERMGRLIGDLVDFAGIQAGRLAIERGSHRPDDIIASARELFGPIAEERGLVFRAFSVPGLPPIECDSDRAIQVISNLVSNALKVTPRGGEIAIGVEPRDDEIVFFVRDTGPGIEPDELDRVFHRSWRPKQSGYRGANLGLTIARGIVDAHGGRIWAASEPGLGSTFYFSFASQRNN